MRHTRTICTSALLGAGALAFLALGTSGPRPAPVAAQPGVTPGFAITTSQSSPVTGAVTLTVDLPSEAGLAGVQFTVDGYPVEELDTTVPYEIVWSAASAVNGEHTIVAEARFTSGNVIASAPLRLTVANPDAFNRTLYVDATSGDDTLDGLSPSTAWRTLTRANYAVVAGDTVLLRGTFVGQIIRPFASGTAARPITYRSVPGTTAVLDGGLWGTGFWLDPNSGLSFIIMDGIAIRNIGRMAILLAWGAHHNVIRNCDLAGGGVIVYGGSNDNTVETSVITDVGNEAANDGDAVWIAHGSSRNLIVNNRLTNGGHSLMQIGGDRADESDVFDNVVANNVLSNRWATPLILTWRARRTLVERNRISDAARNGVNYPRPGIQIVSSENVIRFNTLVDNAGPGMHLGAYNFRGLPQDSIGNQIYHNVFYANGPAGGASAETGQGGLGIYIHERDGRTVRDNLIANNIFFRNTGFAFNGAVYSIVIEHFHAPTAWPDGSLNGNRFARNVVLRQPGAEGEPAILRVRRPDQGGNIAFTVAQFEAAHAEATGNLEADPRFVDETNRVFTLQPDSPAIDRGLVIAGVVAQSAAPDIGLAP